MFKRILSLGLAVVTCMALSSCKAPLEEQSAAVDENKIEEGAALTFWTGDVDFGNAVAESFKAETGITVTVEQIGLESAEKMALDGPAGRGADVFMAPHDKVQYLLSSGLALELNPDSTAFIKDTVNPVAVKTVTKDNKLYGVPVSIETVAMFYNKDVVQGDPAATFEQIFDESKPFNDPNDNKFWFLSSITNGSGAFPFISMNGVNLFGADGTDNEKPGFSDPGFVKALEAVQSFKEIIPISSGDMTMAAAGFLDESFKTGKTAYYMNGPWAVKGFKDAGVNFGVYPIPTYKGKTLKPMAFVQVAHVSAYSKYPVAAQMFARHLVTEQGASALYEKASKITSRKDIENVKGLSTDEYLSPFIKQFSDAVPMPTASRMGYYWTISQDVFSAVFDGAMTPEEAAAKAQADYDALVASE